ncbi:MAG: rRNA pseudouridine synthase [Clostridia bacterium]|nr:rRNA pseudouridine synthase [Clostridia bacterium]
MNKIRLQKYFSECGLMSRRAAEAAIADGRVTVNGEPAVIGQSVDPDADAVLLDGEPVRRDPEKKPVYYMLHKPRGYITSLSDEKGRKCVTELLKDVSERVYPVGRLDYNSEGLLLLTNDGELTNKLMNASCNSTLNGEVIISYSTR